LKSGYLEDGALRHTEAGTPQGGIISPVIANMTLDRLEAAIKSSVARRGACVNVIRYADDCVPRRRTGGRSPPCSYAA